MHDKVHTSRPNFYDYLKVIALISMVIDHIGFFFFPEYEILRVIGRLAFPLFLFLVGYNGSFKRRNSLWLYAIAIQVFIRSTYALGYSEIFYLNILMVIAVVRLILSCVKKNNLVLLLLFVLGLCLVWYTRDYADYGTISLSFAILGYRAASYKPNYRGYLVGGGTLTYYFFFMIYSRGFHEQWYLALGLVSVFILISYLILYHHNYTYKISSRLDRVIQTLSQYALHIYVIHAVILVAIYALMQVL